MPVEPDHSLGRQPAAMSVVHNRGDCGSQFVHIIQKRLKNPCRRDNTLRNTFRETGNGRLLTMNQKYAASNRTALGDPARQLRSIGMSGIVVDAANPRRDLYLVALDTNGFGAAGEKPAEC